MRSYDVVVVGAGIIGATTAFYLARGGKKVALIDKGEFGKEASFVAGGILTPVNIQDYPQEFAKRCRRAASIYPEFLNDLKKYSEVDPQYTKSGVIFLIMDSEDESKIRKIEDCNKTLGIPCQRLSASELLKLEPNSNQDAKGGLYLPDIHQVRSNRLMKALEEALRRLKVDFFLNTCVLEVSGNTVKTTDDVFKSECIVVAAGAWTSQIVQVDIKPIRGQMLVTEAAPQFLNHMLYYKDQYLIPRVDGRVLIGSTLEDVGFVKSVTLEGVNILSSIAVKMAPSISKYPIVKSWAGFRPSAPDRIPVEKKIGPVFISTGHYRNGILLAPTAASLAVKELTGQSIF